MHMAASRADLDKPRLYKDNKSRMSLEMAIKALSGTPVSLPGADARTRRFSLAHWMSSTRSHPTAMKRTRAGQQTLLKPVAGRSGQATRDRN